MGRSVRLLLVPLLASLLSSCGGGGSPAASDACSKACAKCASDICADCPGSAQRFRPEYAAALFSCVDGAAQCSASLWETCAVQAVSGLPARAADDTYRTVCLAKKSECDAQGMGFADDLCVGSSFLSDAWLAMAQACIQLACADAKACLTPIFR